MFWNKEKENNQRPLQTHFEEKKAMYKKQDEDRAALDSAKIISALEAKTRELESKLRECESREWSMGIELNHRKDLEYYEMQEAKNKIEFLSKENARLSFEVNEGKKELLNKISALEGENVSLKFKVMALEQDLKEKK